MSWGGALGTYIRTMRFALIPFLVLLVIPIAEIATFIAVGGAIGIGWTLLLILVTAIIGTFLLRAQGMGLIARIQNEVRAGRVPARELVHGLMLLLAGVLLLTPGFVTDAIGFSLFVPPVRDAVWQLVRGRVTAQLRQGVAGRAFGGADPFGGRDPRDPPRNRRAGTIDLDEGDYQRTDAVDPSPPNEPAAPQTAGRDAPNGAPPRG